MPIQRGNRLFMKKEEEEHMNELKDEVNALRKDSQMLGRISVAVEPFCRTEEDTTYLAVRRLLAEYYSMKADEAWTYLTEEEKRCAT
jgi:hypothetical protein